MSEKLQALLQGSLGYFTQNPHQRSTETGSEELPGWMAEADGWIELQTITAKQWPPRMHLDTSAPEVVLARTPHSAALLLEVRWARASETWGGLTSSTRTFEARTLLAPIPNNEIRSAGLYSLRANFPGIGHWAGMRATKPTYQTDNSGRPTSFSLTVSSGNEHKTTISSGRSISLGTTWRVSGPDDRKIIYAPVTFSCTSSRPMNTWLLLEPVLAFQDLLNIAFNGFVVADFGKGKPDVERDGEDDSLPQADLWNGALMSPNKAARPPKSMNMDPLFTFAQLGGIRAIARWIHLHSKHQRAIRPFTAHYRFGHTLPVVTIMDVAAGIEYWVKCNRERKWAQNTRKKNPRENGANFAAALARKVGRPFADWVGSLEEWADDFNTTYNRLKHAPNYEPDDDHLTMLALSGRHLLASALLDRAANSRNVSRAMFSNHHLLSLGRMIRNYYQ